MLLINWSAPSPISFRVSDMIQHYDVHNRLTALFCNWVGEIPIGWLLLLNTWHLPSVWHTCPLALFSVDFSPVSFHPSSSSWRFFWQWWLLSRCSSFCPPTSSRLWSTRSNKPFCSSRYLCNVILKFSESKWVCCYGTNKRLSYRILSYLNNNANALV